MPENRYSGSVDEIIENVRRQQEGKKPADDSEVNAILASLGLGEKTPPAPKPDRIADKEPESFELSTSQLAAAQTEAIIFLGKVGFSISEEHLKARQYDQYDGAFLLLDETDRFDGAILALPETTCVRVRFRGHHLQSPEQYRRLEAFMQEHHLQICGFSREITLIDYGITNDTEKFVTEICIPVECK